MTPDQIRLLHELSDHLILGLVDYPDYWCGHIRESQGSGTTRDQQWGDAHLFRKTYPWGIAITTAGDYTSQRKATDPEHVVTLTWKQITRWVDSLTDEQRAEARRARMSKDREQEHRAVEQLLAPEPADEEWALW
ncbi:hypothetical protein ACRAJ3_09825 [Rhodococcus pyridinivorans]|uniref:hypothetical protein n=1 Tax=Rhodococcus pyridinivorans TaxID=103816 RepID=UPI003D7FB408